MQSQPSCLEAGCPNPDVGDPRQLANTDAKLSGGTPAAVAAVKARRATITTRGDADAYAAEVLAKVHAVQKERRRLQRGGTAPQTPPVNRP